MLWLSKLCFGGDNFGSVGFLWIVVPPIREAVLKTDENWWVPWFLEDLNMKVPQNLRWPWRHKNPWVASFWAHEKVRCYNLFNNANVARQVWVYPPRNQHSTWKRMVGRQVSFAMAYFQGRNVGFRECMYSFLQNGALVWVWLEKMTLVHCLS